MVGASRLQLHIELMAIVMRGDIARLGRCTLICTQGEDSIKRSKPFKYAYEKEIVMSVPLPDRRFQLTFA